MRSLEERKMNYFMASGCIWKVGLQGILERNFISEWCVILSPCPSIRPKRIHSFSFSLSNFSISMDPKFTTCTTRHMSISSWENEFFTHCWNPYPEQTQHPLRTWAFWVKSVLLPGSTLSIYIHPHGIVSSWGGHCHTVEANVLAGFYLASLSLQSQLNQKASGGFLLLSVNQYGRYQLFITNCSKGGSHCMGFPLSAALPPPT